MLDVCESDHLSFHAVEENTDFRVFSNACPFLIGKLERHCRAALWKPKLQRKEKADNTGGSNTDGGLSSKDS